MPGFLSHVLAGGLMFFVGRFYFKSYFDGKNLDKLLLAVVCLFFSLIIDFFLGVYYGSIFLAGSYFGDFLVSDVFFVFHDFFHVFMFFLAVFGLFSLRFLVDIQRRPIWLMGFYTVILHISMDVFIEETGLYF
jgi:hypothetical protein